MEPSLRPLRRLRSVEPVPWRTTRALRTRVKLPAGARTTLHVASFALSDWRARVVAFEHPQPLVRWCRDGGSPFAVVGGFFVRPSCTPLGELRIDGSLRESIGFDAPWDTVRGCVQIDGGTPSVARRDQLPAVPSGDLLQAGPVLVADGRRVIEDGVDAEGFSAGSRQFDSDITVGRYPRAALAVDERRVFAVACDGRTDRDAGMTLGELADTLVVLGARDALNLDGGGSAALVYNGRLRNRPREEHGVDLLEGRTVATAIVFEPR